ncbi:hypothetical protein MPL3356_340165 [Mesorhizobium plurifarium]|uniref:Uncharacterized protein n=1 Tax=Mesorhizobium plurifarium TaxID=69974 RepID=A0A090DVQ5_MESPL|nr:hypothetical protein MPL3356_340165 [Mesorhizobium plurifarium]
MNTVDNTELGKPPRQRTKDAPTLDADVCRLSHFYRNGPVPTDRVTYLDVFSRLGARPLSVTFPLLNR